MRRIPPETLEARRELLARACEVLRQALRNTIDPDWERSETEALERAWGKQGKK